MCDSKINLVSILRRIGGKKTYRCSEKKNSKTETQPTGYVHIMEDNTPLIGCILLCISTLQEKPLNYPKCVFFVFIISSFLTPIKDPKMKF